MPLSAMRGAESFFYAPMHGGRVDALVPVVPAVPVTRGQVVFLLHSLLHASLKVSLSVCDWLWVYAILCTSVFGPYTGGKGR